MAKKQSDGVYRIIDVVGVSEKSWEDAGRIAVETAAGSLRDLRVAEVTKMDMRWITERSRRFAPASHFRSSTRLDPISAVSSLPQRRRISAQCRLYLPLQSN